MTHSSPEPTRPAVRREALLVGVSLLGFTLLLCVALSATRPPEDDGDDLVEAELARLSELVASTNSSDALWLDVKGVAATTLERAAAALRDGRRLLALQRLAAARINIAAAVYMLERIASGEHDEAAFEAEWKRQRLELESAFTPPDLHELRPAAVRAMAESALYEVPILHATSLDYGRATEPEIGLFYLGQAQAQVEFAELCRALPRDEAAAARPDPPLRDLTVELDALESEIVAAYKPPASIDRHPEFITTGSYLKAAREQNALGLRAGALLAYLHAVMRFASLRDADGAAPDAAGLSASLDAAAARFAAPTSDQSLGALFVEAGQSDLAATAVGAEVPSADDEPRPRLAAAIVSDVLPRYDAALRPGQPAPVRPTAEVDITLVRWPFT